MIIYYGLLFIIKIKNKIKECVVTPFLFLEQGNTLMAINKTSSIQFQVDNKPPIKRPLVYIRN